jgi:general secretion pathway protein G
MSRAVPPPARPEAGFTLIEIMVVVAIIGLLLTLVAPNFFTQQAEAQITITKAKMGHLKQAIENYRRHYSKVPDSLDALLEPSEKNLGRAYVETEAEVSDAWDNRFQYDKLSNSKYDIISLGADGVEGGENEDADIHSATGTP